MRALLSSTLACALFGWGQHAEVRSVVALVLVVLTVCTLEASPRAGCTGKSEGAR